ncbi:MAG TPA: PatB family C-S lyase [Lentimicrobium sp.]|nr:PatB family C-S lyase [Lentimicrobium sp.]
MGKYDFDELIERSNTDSVKYDLRKQYFGTDDIIPMWVADMDFKTPDFILNAIKTRLEHSVLGYSIRTQEYFDAIRNWFQRRHNWTINNDWISFSPGIVPALNMMVLTFTHPGDKVIVQPPVYFPFFSSVKGNGRTLLFNELKLENGRYEIDYANLEKLCKKASMIFISNPHNPGGNAWTEEELKEMAEICLKHNVLIVSDEIHADLVNIGFKHTVMASLGNKIAQGTITLHAPSKTFNMAGLSTASVIISNPALKNKYDKLVQNLHIDMGNVFGNVASIAAFNHGDEWLDQLIVYIDGNINFLRTYLLENIPAIKMIKPEATYMAWLDCKALNMDDKQLSKFFIQQAKLGLSPGFLFGKGGSGFMRINLACPRALLQKGLDQLKNAINYTSAMNTV